MKLMSSLLVAAAAPFSFFPGDAGHAAGAVPERISVSPLNPERLGATMKPRWPGSADRIPYLGTARLNWAYTLAPQAGARVRRAAITGIAPVHLFLDDGQCVAFAPKVVNGQAVSATTNPEPCPAAPDTARCHAAGTSRSRLVGSSAEGRLTVWTSGDGATSFVRRGMSGAIVARLPVRAEAVGTLPVLHGGGTDVTVYGELGGVPVVVNVTAPAQSPLGA